MDIDVQLWVEFWIISLIELKISAKVQFRGLELYKEIEDINRSRKYLMLG